MSYSYCNCGKCGGDKHSSKKSCDVIRIKSLPYVITHSGSYCFDHLDYSNGVGAAVTVNASGVFINFKDLKMPNSGGVVPSVAFLINTNANNVVIYGGRIWSDMQNTIILPDTLATVGIQALNNNHLVLKNISIENLSMGYDLLNVIDFKSFNNMFLDIGGRDANLIDCYDVLLDKFVDHNKLNSFIATKAFRLTNTSNILVTNSQFHNTILFPRSGNNFTVLDSQFSSEGQAFTANLQIGSATESFKGSLIKNCTFLNDHFLEPESFTTINLYLVSTENTVVEDCTFRSKIVEITNNDNITCKHKITIDPLLGELVIPHRKSSYNKTNNKKSAMINDPIFFPGNVGILVGFIFVDTPTDFLKGLLVKNCSFTGGDIDIGFVAGADQLSSPNASYTGIVLKECQFSNLGRAIEFDNKVSDSTIDNCYIQHNIEGILVKDTSINTFIKNVIRGNRDVGLRIFELDTSSLANYFQGNIISNNGALNILDEGTGTIFAA